MISIIIQTTSFRLSMFFRDSFLEIRMVGDTCKTTYRKIRKKIVYVFYTSMECMTIYWSKKKLVYKT